MNKQRLAGAIRILYPKGMAMLGEGLWNFGTFFLKFGIDSFLLEIFSFIYLLFFF